ncbi:MAG: CPBP family intramembrane glutamic endopeptidase [Prochlorotrichaceae cyanobacterium]
MLNLSVLRGLDKLPAPARLLMTLGVLVLVWLPLGLPILHWVPDPDWQSILALGLAYGLFIAIVRGWGTIVAQRSFPLEHYGLTFKTIVRPGLRGGIIGTGVVLGLYTLQGQLGWVIWTFPHGQELDFLIIALEGGAVAIGIGFAEEFFFRGWLLSELAADYGFSRAAIVSSGLFALLHFIKPWSEILRTLPQFPGLFLLGLILARAKQQHLGQAMGIHGGLVWGYYLLKVGDLVIQRDEISPWITGVDGNPLAGVLGLVALTVWLCFPAFRR